MVQFRKCDFKHKQGGVSKGYIHQIIRGIHEKTRKKQFEMPISNTTLNSFDDQHAESSAVGAANEEVVHSRAC